MCMMNIGIYFIAFRYQIGYQKAVPQKTIVVPPILRLFIVKFCTIFLVKQSGRFNCLFTSNVCDSLGSVYHFSHPDGTYTHSSLFNRHCEPILRYSILRQLLQYQPFFDLRIIRSRLKERQYSAPQHIAMQRPAKKLQTIFSYQKYPGLF